MRRFEAMLHTIYLSRALLQDTIHTANVEGFLKGEPYQIETLKTMFVDIKEAMKALWRYSNREGDD